MHLDPPTRAWAESVLGEPIEQFDPLSGGWTSRMLRLTSASGRRTVLRSMDKDPWRRHAEQLLSREAGIHRQLAGSGIPVPETLGVDPAGKQAGLPSLLMTLLPGRLELTRADDAVLTELARMLAAIHAIEPDPRPREYQSWAHEAKRVVPEWTDRPELWQQAFDLLADDPPPYDAVFLHRDFHLGNVLWSDGAISGVVDWVETSWGPAWLDVAHCRTYLAMLHGPDTAAAFADRYGTGRASSYWDCMDIVGYLPDPVKVVQPWRDNGREITDETARLRLEEQLTAVLS